MTPTGVTSAPPTARQLAYLKSLAAGAGQSFAWPPTRSQASREIRRLKTLPPSDARPTEFDVDAERAAREANGDVPIEASEIAGYGSNCRWR
jgi:hypothetical protein